MATVTPTEIVAGVQFISDLLTGIEGLVNTMSTGTGVVIPPNFITNLLNDLLGVFTGGANDSVAALGGAAPAVTNIFTVLGNLLNIHGAATAAAATATPVAPASPNPTPAT